MQWVVSIAESDQKLVVFLKNKLGSKYSARQIKNALENSLCRVNQRLEHFASAILLPGDKVNFEVEALGIKKPKTVFVFNPADIVYEDQELLIYNKPSGIASDSRELTRALHNYSPDWELLHRLDKETTGLLMFTKGAAFRKKMIDAFKTHRVEKIYLAIVDGTLRQPSGIIDGYIGKIHEYEGQTLWGSISDVRKGQYAVTAWELEKKGNQVSLVRCYPKTGRTHQIRVHMSEIGHPIIGDKQYGRIVRCRYNAARCLLHAYKLSFVHPTRQEQVFFQAPIPQDFQQALDQLIGSA